MSDIRQSGALPKLLACVIARLPQRFQQGKMPYAFLFVMLVISMLTPRQIRRKRLHLTALTHLR